MKNKNIVVVVVLVVDRFLPSSKPNELLIFPKLYSFTAATVPYVYILCSEEGKSSVTVSVMSFYEFLFNK